MRVKFNLPERRYCGGDKKMVSMRLPETLWAEVEKVGFERGWNATDTVATVLDQFCAWAAIERDRKKAKKA
jgi:hypothetical protein